MFRSESIVCKHAYLLTFSCEDYRRPHSIIVYSVTLRMFVDEQYTYTQMYALYMCISTRIALALHFLGVYTAAH